MENLKFRIVNCMYVCVPCVMPAVNKPAIAFYSMVPTKRKPRSYSNNCCEVCSSISRHMTTRLAAQEQRRRIYVRTCRVRNGYVQYPSLTILFPCSTHCRPVPCNINCYHVEFTASARGVCFVFAVLRCLVSALRCFFTVVLF